ncbi:hypothetical protein MMC18_008229 [Xylographa bjoerkii]|nr:hypothetical protein [Xylographa bjoerkii]
MFRTRSSRLLQGSIQSVSRGTLLARSSGAFAHNVLPCTGPSTPGPDPSLRPAPPLPFRKSLIIANFSAADMRYCSIPYSQDPKEPEPLFPIRHPIVGPSTLQALRWYEWVNELPLPHIFRREISRIEWLDIDVARRGISDKPQECFITITIMVEELSPNGGEMVIRLAGVLHSQGYSDVRVELAVYWCSVADEFRDEYMRGLEELLVGSLTESLSR